MSAAPAPAAVVLVAMEEEAEPFLARAERLGEPVAAAQGPALRRDLALDGVPFALLRSGIGFVNGVAAAAYAFYAFGPAVPLISAGTAGGLAAGVRLGGVILGERCVNLNADATAFGYALGQVPGMPESYAADEELLAAASSVSSDGGLATGVIGSSEAFVTETRALGLRADFPGVVAVDMESAAIAQFAHTHGQRFLSARAISDLCAPDGTEFLTHVDTAAERSAEAVLATIMSL